MPELPTATVVSAPAWRRLLATIFGSKKIVIAIATAAVMFLRPYLDKVGVEITVEEMQGWVAIALTLILGIGLADHGKEAAKITAAARAADPPAAPTQVVAVVPNKPTPPPLEVA